MRHDLFQVKKSVQVKLSKEMHSALRQKLFTYGLTMQDVFHEAAEMALHEGVRSEKFLQRISKKKLTATIEKINGTSSKSFDDLDKESLYNLLENSDEYEDPAQE